ncbi:ARVCF delta catenin family member, partial [Podarcis lilfordi]
NSKPFPGKWTLQVTDSANPEIVPRFQVKNGPPERIEFLTRGTTVSNICHMQDAASMFPPALEDDPQRLFQLYNSVVLTASRPTHPGPSCSQIPSISDEGRGRKLGGGGATGLRSAATSLR